MLLLLPPDYCGTVSVTSPSAPNWDACLLPALDIAANTAGTTWNARVVPPHQRMAQGMPPGGSAGRGVGLSEVLNLKNKKGYKTKGTSVEAQARRHVGRLPAAAAVAGAGDVVDGVLDTAVGGEYLNVEMVSARFSAVSRAAQSKIVIKTDKGTVLVGYGGTPDRERVRELEMRVGEGSKPKSWWRSTF